MAALFALSLVTLLAGVGLAIDSTNDGAIQLRDQGASDAATRSAALVWGADHPHLPLVYPDDTSLPGGVVMTAQSVAALNGVDTNSTYSCVITNTPSQYDVIFYDAPPSRSGGECGAPASWRYSLEVAIPPRGDLPSQCVPNPAACVGATAHTNVRNYLGGVTGTKLTGVAATSVKLATVLNFGGILSLAGLPHRLCGL